MAGLGGDELAGGRSEFSGRSGLRRGRSRTFRPLPLSHQDLRKYTVFFEIVTARMLIKLLS